MLVHRPGPARQSTLVERRRNLIDVKRVGAAQMSRIDSARIAAIKAANAKLDIKGSAVASDDFFPFRDGLDVVVDVGAGAFSAR